MFNKKKLELIIGELCGMEYYVSFIYINKTKILLEAILFNNY